MPRPKGKASKIAYKVMGIPPAMRKNKGLRINRTEKRLERWETSRIR